MLVATFSLSNLFSVRHVLKNQTRLGARSTGYPTPLSPKSAAYGKATHSMVRAMCHVKNLNPFEAARVA